MLKQLKNKLFGFAENNTPGEPPNPGKPESLSSLYNKNTETSKLHNLYTREFSELSVEQIKFYFDSARKGINFFKAFLFEEIRRRDLRVGGICQTRKLSVLFENFEIKGDDEKLVEFVKDNFARIKIWQLISDIVEAQLQGISIFQLFYSLEDNKYYLSDVSLVPNYLIFYKDINDGTDGIHFIDFDKLNIYSLRSEAAVDNPNPPLIDLNPLYYYPVYSFDGNEENGILNGVIDSIIWGYFFKSYGLKDYSVFLERFAIPGVVGKYDPLMSKGDREALWNAVKNFGNLFKAMIPNTADLDTLSDQSKGSAGQLYNNYIKYWNDELSIRVLGQAMTTDTSEGGSYAKAKVGQQVREDIQRGDKALIKEAMNGLIKKLIDINYPGVKEYPEFAFVEDDNMNYKNSKADLLVKLKQSGFEADEDEVSETFGITLKKTSADTPGFREAKFTDTLSNKVKKNVIDEYLMELLKDENELKNLSK